MTEITENGVVYIVSDDYPKIPYTKTIKTVAPAPAEDRLSVIEAKLDTILTQTKAK